MKSEIEQQRSLPLNMVVSWWREINEGDPRPYYYFHGAALASELRLYDELAFLRDIAWVLLDNEGFKP